MTIWLNFNSIKEKRLIENKIYINIIVNQENFMSNYKTILLAIDFSNDAHAIADRAKQVAQTNNSVTHIIHVTEPLNYLYSSENFIGFADLEEQLRSDARAQLQQFSEHYHIPPAQQHFEEGRAAREIHAVSEKINADLIVIGSHGHRGFAALLGSTANSVLHSSKCDVLAVRVGKN
ncbi:MAG: universal stress protein [Pseudomonadota bacterium]